MPTLEISQLTSPSSHQACLFPCLVFISDRVHYFLCILLQSSISAFNISIYILYKVRKQLVLLPTLVLNEHFTPGSSSPSVVRPSVHSVSFLAGSVGYRKWVRSLWNMLVLFLQETVHFIAPKVWLLPYQRRQQRAQQLNEWSGAKPHRGVSGEASWDNGDPWDSPVTHGQPDWQIRVETLKRELTWTL